MDYIKVPLSSEIDNLDDSESYDINNNIDLDLDEIISNQVLYDNNFIKDVMNGYNFNDKESIPYFHNILKIYLKIIINNLYPKNCKNNFLILIIRILHILGFIYLLFGCLSPTKLLKYHVILCIKTLLLWEFLEDKCYISMFIQKISNLNKYPDFFSEDIDFLRNLIIYVMFISIIGIIAPDLSLFKIIYYIVENLKKYD